MNVQGGSVIIASNRSPHRQGFCVMSKVHRSIILVATPYCVAARMMPGVSPSTREMKHFYAMCMTRGHLFPSFVVHQYQIQKFAHQSKLSAGFLTETLTLDKN